MFETPPRIVLLQVLQAAGPDILLNVPFKMVPKVELQQIVFAFPLQQMLQEQPFPINP